MTDVRKKQLINQAVTKPLRAYNPTEVTTKDVLCIIAGCIVGTAISCYLEYTDINRRLKKLEEQKTTTK